MKWVISTLCQTKRFMLVIMALLPMKSDPRKRMLSSMTPTIVAKDGKPYLVIGSPGGKTIINTVFQTVLGVTEYNMRVDKAIEALKVHHQWLPDRLTYEESMLSPDTRDILGKMGHTLSTRGSLGALMGIQWDAENKVLIGASDSSRPDGAAVVELILGYFHSSVLIIRMASIFIYSMAGASESFFVEVRK